MMKEVENAERNDEAPGAGSGNDDEVAHDIKTASLETAGVQKSMR